MLPRFRHVALIGKYQAQGIEPVLNDIAQLLLRLGSEVALERDTALNTSLAEYPTLTVADI
ncbi:hypothetical protein OFB92_33170, partial [Escherichia coli]|nr:hypothetical protein [Escherichia coli]